MKYYLIENGIKKGKDIPFKSLNKLHKHWYEIDFKRWLKSLKDCSITEDELENIQIWLSENSYDGDWREPIDVTEIIYAIYDSENDIDIIEFKYESQKNIVMKDNKIELLKEDLECIHLYLDDLKIPRKDSNNDDYSIVGRIKFLESKNTNEESQEKLYDDFAKTIVSGGLNLCRKHFTLSRK